MPIIRGGIMLKVRHLYSPRAWRRWMKWSALNNRQPTRWVLWRVATVGACLQAILLFFLKKTPTASKRTTFTSRAGTMDSTGAFPVKERLPKDIITRTATVTITTLLEPFPQGFIIPVIIMLRVTPFGRGTMVLAIVPMFVTGTVTTLPGTADTSTGPGTDFGVEDIAVDIKADMADEVEEAAADVPGVAAVVAAVKAASAVVTRFLHFSKIIQKGAPARGAFFYLE